MFEVCIVGGSGFIGTSVASRLVEKNIPFSIVDQRDSVRFPNKVALADVRDLGRLRQVVSGNSILHLAAVHRDDVRPVSLYDSVNVEGTRNLCFVADEKGIDSIIFASSVAVYGFAEKATDETGEVAPFNDYGRTKAEAEKVLRHWQATEPNRRSLTIIRPAVVFGPGNRGNVFNLFNQIASRRFVMIGDGKNCKSMAYVENVSDFFLHFLDQKPGVYTYNYIDGPDMNMNQLISLARGKLFGKENVGFRFPAPLGFLLGSIADVASALTGKRFPISAQRIRKFVSDTSFATAHTTSHGFVPQCDLRSAIEITLEAEFINPLPERQVFFTE